MTKIQKLTLQDLHILEILSHHTSLRSLARSERLSISQVSKALSRIEKILNKELIKRSNSGFLLTAEGLNAAQVARLALTQCENLAGNVENPNAPKKWLVLGTRGFLNVLLAPYINREFLKAEKPVGFRFLDFSPDELVVAAFRGVLDIAVTIEKIYLGERWISYEIGQTGWGLYVRKGHALEGRKLLPEKLEYPVLGSAYWDGHTVVLEQSLLKSNFYGHSIQTAATAISIILNSESAAVLPKLAAEPEVLRGNLVRLNAPLAETAEKLVCLHINQDSIDTKTSAILRSVVQDCVKKFG